MALTTRPIDPTTPSLYVALELSKDTWKLGITPSRTQRARIRDVRARDLEGLLTELTQAKRHFRLPTDATGFTCYEAGRAGFWIHRFLAATTAVGPERARDKTPWPSSCSWSRPPSPWS